MSGAVDEARDVREGDELDVEALSDWLGAHVEGIEGPVEVRQFPGGHSNLTYLVQAGDRELVLRRPPPGAKTVSGHDMGREHRILSRLPDVYDKAPRSYGLCEDESILGAPFYVAERLTGVILRRQKAPEGLDLNPTVMRALSENLVDGLAELHAVDYTAAGLEDLGHPEGYTDRQVEGWTRRYQKAKTDEISDMETVARWLADHTPETTAASLIHNDYKYDNVVLDPDDLTRIIGVLDWEMCTLGDPLSDLGSSLAYWIRPEDDENLRNFPVGPTMLEGNLTRQGVVDRYAEKSGRDVDHIVFYYAYGLFKLCVIAQQIYARFKAGHTKDPRFGAMIFGVMLLSAQGVRAIDTGRIEGFA